MNFRDRTLSEEGFENTGDGFKVTLRIPRYRSLPLSCIRVDTLTVDGKNVDPDTITFYTHGKSYPHPDLENQIDEEWFLQDPAELRVQGEKLEPGEHDVQLQLKLRIPYVFVEGGTAALTEVAGAKKRLTLSAAAR